MADHLCRRLVGLFLRDQDGKRPVFGDCAIFQTDPHFRDLILFHEYFDGDTGRGLGAGHQTGWTGLVANLIDQLATGRSDDVIVWHRVARAPSGLTRLRPACG